MSNSLILKITEEFIAEANESKASTLQRFFKTEKDQYAEGDKFLGINTPTIRYLSKKYSDIDYDSISHFLTSEFHEHRMFSLFILINNYQIFFKKNEFDLAFDVVRFYIFHVNYINNWDLVDVSCYKILGHCIYHMHEILESTNTHKNHYKDLSCIEFIDINDSKLDFSQKITELLNIWVKSDHLWKKRISIISSMYLIKKNEFNLTIEFAKILLKDKHDLIHKGVGWMLREIGKNDLQVLLNFLNEFTTKMPRTMLRYAIEKLENREYFLKMK